MQISQRELLVHGGQEITGTIGIDETLSTHLTFTFYFETDAPFVDIFSPSGVIFDAEDSHFYLNTELNLIKFHFDFVEVMSF